MRVVVLEPDAEVRGVLQQIVEEQPEFTLVGESRTWSECEELLNAYIPELLILRAGTAMPPVVSDVLFPVRVGVRQAGSCSDIDDVLETLDLPLDQRSLRMMLERARTEIYRRKLDELSDLLQRYVSFWRGTRSFPASVSIENGTTSEIPADHVIFISADGNYLQVHAATGVHELRDTMSAMSSRLDPEQFTRVHRSFIVNRAHVRNVVRRQGTAICVELSNGAEVPIGPNYRSEVERFEAPAGRLTA
jgi:two-component system LytT family response regulator